MKKWLLLVVFMVMGLGKCVVSAKAQGGLETNPILWKTEYTKLAADNFYIRIGDDYYYGTNDQWALHANPAITDYTTLEANWREHDAEMRVFLYFRKPTPDKWELYEIRTYNGERPYGDWIYYEPQDASGSAIVNDVGKDYYVDEIRFLPKSTTDAEIVCQRCIIGAFLNEKKYKNHVGYSLQLTDETISLTTDPTVGWGVNAFLRDESGQVVTNQRDISYKWEPSNKGVIDLSVKAIEFSNGQCAYGMKSPCPKINAQIRGMRPGVTSVRVTAWKDNQLIAANSFDVRVTNVSPLPSYSPSPSPNPKDTTPLTTSSPSALSKPTPSNNNSAEMLQNDVEALKGIVGKIQLDVQKQQEEISWLKRIVNRIVNFFNKLKLF